MARFEHLDLMREMHEKKFINIQKHPRFPLWICNYSKRAQHKDMWNDATCNCRGLILDKDNNIVSRPFKKFFNYSETNPEDIPNEPFTVTDKVDGSLGISYFHKGVWRIATRGSFRGKHAQKASRMLRYKYAHCQKNMQPEYTYLFEIIYPENHIVVDYGDREELILLAVINTETGEEITTFADIGFPVLTHYDGINSLEDVLKLNEDNAEGVVVRFASGFRLKVKFPEYMRLHSIMLDLTEIKVWRHLSSGRSIDELVKIADEEYRAWLKTTADKILTAYNNVYDECMAAFRALPHFSSRKNAAEHIVGKKYDYILFNLLDNNPIEKHIWNAVKPDESGSWFAERG